MEPHRALLGSRSQVTIDPASGPPLWPDGSGMDVTALTAAAIGVGGTVIVGIAGFWANVRNTNKITGLTEQGQLTDRYSKAVEQLGSEKRNVRIGGIYALERIARDSPQDHPTIMEVLTAFIREQSHEQWPSSKSADAPAPKCPPRSDVQAALTVVGRRRVKKDKRPIDLSDSELGGAKLPRGKGFRKAKLMRAVLADVDLTGADLAGADLAGAHLPGAQLMYADLRPAALTEKEREDAKLPPGAKEVPANLTGADLTGADLTGADLSRADLSRADLSRADLTEATLSGAEFSGADLTDARWPLGEDLPKGWQRVAGSDRLKRDDT